MTLCIMTILRLTHWNFRIPIDFGKKMSKTLLNNLIKIDFVKIKIKKPDRISHVSIQFSGDNKSQDVTLQKTDCFFGGYRYWFTCPFLKEEKTCGRRVRILYWFNGYWGCRHCFNLVYRSQNLSGISKLWGVYLDPNSYKRRTYKGIPPKRYARYLRKEKENDQTYKRLLVLFVQKLQKRIEKMKEK